MRPGPLVEHKSKTNVTQKHATLRNQTDAPTEVRFRAIKCATKVEPIVDWRMVPQDCLPFTSAENKRAEV